MKRSLLTAEEAADALGVSRSTLYAYVSRGLVRSERSGTDERSRLYRGEDVAALIERRENRRRPERVAAGALRWGAPVLDSAITLIADGRVHYRGQDVALLARGAELRAVATLLWGVEPPSGSDGAVAVTSGDGLVPPMLETMPPMRLLDRFVLALPIAAARHAGAWDLSPEGAARSGWHILRLFAEVTARSGPHEPRGAEAWAALPALLGDGAAPSRPAEAASGSGSGSRRDLSRSADLLRAALVLTADHELNVSTFTVRCAASAGSSPYAAVAAGLAALQGTRHGGVTERVERFMDEAPTGDETAWVAARLRSGERPPGFGHPMYPDGDPRARALLDLVQEAHAGSAALARARALADAVEAAAGERPNVDYALTVLARVLGLPAGAPLTIFALGRTIGWIAHAIEQYAAGALIRPRARYIGPLPG